jgi:hypothetical protein
VLLKHDTLYKVFELPKRNGNGFRQIQNPDDRLKKIQSVFMARFLEPIQLGDHVGAYVRGRSCADTAAQHVKKAVIVSMDLKDFFPSVKRGMIRSFLHSKSYNHYVASMMSTLVTYHNFVPQGAPSSGMVANLITDARFDQPLLRALSGTGWTYTRYSDDMDFSHVDDQTDNRIQALVALVSDFADKAGFKIKTDKNKVERCNRPQHVLGMTVNEKVSIPRCHWRLMRAVVHNCLAHGFDSQKERMHMGSSEQLAIFIRGKIAYFNQVEPGKAAELNDLFAKACEIHGVHA